MTPAEYSFKRDLDVDLLESLRAGDDGFGNCRGCGLPLERVADGAASGCAVCLRWLDHYAKGSA